MFTVIFVAVLQAALGMLSVRQEICRNPSQPHDFKSLVIVTNFY
ncbi:hypothetical protein YH61_01165 [Helicobacter pylori J99]|uniref:Putative n=2 Tax=Helicobacter pylori TaxID=210 RepID=Q9ZL59_HELPJ|nr:putative [Helicobacter pylori J99]ABF84837.1 hypothetical protein HPAG1_0770 [Helicobacter pylori HPAG1]AKE81307.1 hypothetical protein YH61_01165 [Helicobacter pylori J99]